MFAVFIRIVKFCYYHCLIVVIAPTLSHFANRINYAFLSFAAGPLFQYLFLACIWSLVAGSFWPAGKMASKLNKSKMQAKKAKAILIVIVNLLVCVSNIK